MRHMEGWNDGDNWLDRMRCDAMQCDGVEWVLRNGVG